MPGYWTWVFGKALSLAGQPCSGVGRGNDTLWDFIFGFQSLLVCLGRISQVFFCSHKDCLSEKTGCQRLPKLMGVKGEFSLSIMRTECLPRDQFRQDFSGLEAWDVTSVVQSPFP